MRKGILVALVVSWCLVGGALRAAPTQDAPKEGAAGDAPVQGGEWRIEGEVVLQTGTPKRVPGQAVTFNLMKAGQVVASEQAQSDEKGAFVFSGIEIPEGTIPFLVAAYKGVRYRSVLDPSKFPDHRISVELSVYESSKDRSILSIAGDHQIIDPAGGKLAVMEIVVLENRSDRAFNDPERGVPLPLPVTGVFESVQGVPPRTIVLENGRYRYKGAVYPGRQEMSIAYRIPYTTPVLSFEKPLDLPIGRFMLLLKEGPVRAEGEGLRELETRRFGESTYRIYQSATMGKGQNFTITLSNLPVPEAPATLRDVLMGLAAGVILLPLCFKLFSRSRKAEARLAAALAEHNARKLEILKEMLRKGEIEGEEYLTLEARYRGTTQG